MTKVVFFRREGRLIGFEAKGHSGFAEEGSDIVCAAVSAVTQTLAIQAENVLEMKEAVFVDENKAILRVTGENNEAWESALTAAEMFLCELSRQYPRHLTTRITEV